MPDPLDKIPRQPGLFLSKSGSKTAKREFVATVGLLWLQYQKRRGRRGAVVFDIDDTLIDYRDKVESGFDAMVDLFQFAARHFCTYVVTARPFEAGRQGEEDVQYVHDLLRERGIVLPRERLYLMPLHEYNKGGDATEAYKTRTTESIRRREGVILARFGDKMWDCVASSGLHGAGQYTHVSDGDAYLGRDGHTVFGKLPGQT